MLLKSKLTLGFCLITLFSFSQKGPGGIGTIGATGDMYMWLRPELGLTTTASGVSAWADQSGYLNSGSAYSLAQVDINAQPAFGTNQMNGIDVITFDGTDDFLSFDLADFTEDEYDMFFVWRRNEGVEGESSLFSSASSNSSVGGFQLSHVSGGSNSFRLLLQGDGTKDVTGSTTRTADNNILEVIREVIDPGTPTIPSDDDHNFISFINSNTRGPITKTGPYSKNTTARNFTDLTLGRDRTGDNYLGLDLAEVVFFKEKLNDAERNIVTNYLSAKYDIRLIGGTTSAIPDLYTQDDAANGNFDHDVIGIGQAADGTSSTSAEGTGMLGLSNPSALANEDYLFIGHNNTSLDVDEEVNIPSTINNRISRVWRASKTNDLGTVTVTIDLGFSANKASFTTSNLKLLVNNTINFDSSSVTEYGAPNLTYDSSTGIAVFTNVTISNNDYITIGSTTSPAIYFGTSGSAGGATGDDLGVSGYQGPGGIGSVDGSSMYMWIRPDKGVNTNTAATRVNSWEDQSGFKHNGIDTYTFIPGPIITGVTGTRKPQFGRNQINGYDIATFDGINDHILFDIDAINDTSYEMYFIWKNNQTTTELNASVFSNSDNISDSGSFQVSHTDNANDFYVRTEENGNKNIGNASFTRSNHILSFQRKITDELEVSVNGSSPVFDGAFGSGDPSIVMATFNELKFGSNRGNNVFLNMNLAEALFFNKSINLTQRIILQNYLGAKYDITVANDKYSYDGADGFDHHLAGIGSETATNFHKDAKGTGPVRINNPSGIDAGEYLLWATDEINSTFDVDAPSASNNFSNRLIAKWKVAETGGDVGTVDVTFTASDLNFPTGVVFGCANYTLIVDNDADFSSPTQQIPMVLSGDEISGSGVNFVDGDYFTLQLSNTIVYNGAWIHPSGSGLAPGIDDDCFDVKILSGSVAIDHDLDVNSIEVSDGATLAINTTRTLTVHDNINLNTSGELKLLGTAQMLQNPGVSVATNPNTGTGFYNEFTAPAKDLYSYSYISPSASNGTTYNFETNLKDGRDTNGLSISSEGADFIFHSSYDGIQGATSTTLSNEWIYTYEDDATGYVLQKETGNINVGLGVIVKEAGTAAQTFISTGVPNTGDYTFSASRNSVVLLGNPYPSAIDANKFLTDNNRVDALYFYEDHATSASHSEADYDGGYAAYTLFAGGVAAAITAFDGSPFTGVIIPGQFIPVGQGFFASVANSGSTSTNVRIRNSQRASVALGTTSKFFKQKGQKTLSENKDVLKSIRLGFEAGIGGGRKYHRQIGVNFKEGNLLDSLDRGYDIVLFDENPKDMFVASKENKFVLAGVTAISDDLEIPLTVVLDESQEISIMLDNIQNIEEIYLKDKVENTVESLKGNVIKRTLDSGIYTDRFALTFKNEGTLSDKKAEKAIDKDFSIAVNEGVITVISDKYDITSLRVLDFTGKELKRSEKNTINTSGIYSRLIILKIDSKEGVFVKKMSL